MHTHPSSTNGILGMIGGMDIGGSRGIGIGVVGDVSSSVVVLFPSDEMVKVVGTDGGCDPLGVVADGGAAAAIVFTSSISESMPCAKSI